MKWLQAIRQKLPQHKYAINAKQLGDDAVLAWSNLGYWDDATSSYPEACRNTSGCCAQGQRGCIIYMPLNEWALTRKII